MIPQNRFSRPGTQRTDTVGVVFHWTEVPGQDAPEVEKYFASLANQDPNDGAPDRYGSAHAVIGIDGDLRYLIPWDEIAYHVGGVPSGLVKQYPDSRVYTPFWSSRWPQWAGIGPQSANQVLIGVELCFPHPNGRFTDRTLDAAEELGWMLCNRYGLRWRDMYRHYDITGKECPKWFVDNPKEWDLFVNRFEGGW